MNRELENHEFEHELKSLQAELSMFDRLGQKEKANQTAQKIGKLLIKYNKWVPSYSRYTGGKK